MAARPKDISSLQGDGQPVDIMVRVCEDLNLNAGRIRMEDNTYIVDPPDKLLIDQLTDWLFAKPDPPVPHINTNVFLNIGLIALCLRWGTYLTVLMDEDKPVYPRAKKTTGSTIASNEIKRINIEASSSLARLLELRHRDEEKFIRLLRRAFYWLPMPCRKVHEISKSCDNILRAIELYPRDSLKDLDNRLRETAAKHPYRVYANFMIDGGFRSGLIENIHGGKSGACSLTHRRFTKKQTNDILCWAIVHIGAAVNGPMPWDDSYTANLGIPWPENVMLLVRLGPPGWSLTDSTSQITLPKECTE